MNLNMISRVVVVGAFGVVLAGCNVSKFRTGWQPPPELLTSPTAPARIDAAKIGADINVVNAQEVDLVEALLTYRAQYHRTLQQLRDYYKAHGYDMKQKWADYELEGLKSVKAFRYLLEAEIPGEQLKPTETITAADQLYEEARALMRRGGYGAPGLYREDLMVQAAQMLRSLIEQYPSSDKIDDTAFLLGEIHKEYLKNQEMLAVKWYERCWTWNPDTPHPARYRAAVVYDFRLRDRARALELYRAVVADERTEWLDRQFARRRVQELTSATTTAGQ
ncbi:MAG TPA: hypothetical protein PKK06_02750 [Phycisphaerae bacterium]|nr:hypothetical protein [Phycisphaerae bacterium]HNU44605.1 hypothetical protein [Phycisphaerae bacterium]